MPDKPRSQIDIYDGTAQTAGEIVDLYVMHAKYFGPSKPFYWTAPAGRGKTAPTGWYQWTESGLTFLGESVLSGAGGRDAE